MIKITQKPYGYKLTYSNVISMQGIKDWLKESEMILVDSPESFSVLIDMRTMELLPVECKDIMFQGQRLYKRMGMERSVVIVADKLTAMQFRIIAQKTGIYEYERYIDASLNQNWEKEAMDWLLKSLEPTSEEELTQRISIDFS